MQLARMLLMNLSYCKNADPHIQIAEMARTEERMKKPRVTTNAPKPSRKISGDASTEMPKHSIDS